MMNRIGLNLRMVTGTMSRGRVSQPLSDWHDWKMPASSTVSAGGKDTRWWLTCSRSDNSCGDRCVCSAPPNGVHAEDSSEPTEFQHTLLVLSQLQLQRQFQQQATYTVLAAPRQSIVVPMSLMYRKVCGHRRLVRRALIDCNGMCTMSGCESWGDLFAKYGVDGLLQSSIQQNFNATIQTTLMKTPGPRECITSDNHYWQ